MKVTVNRNSYFEDKNLTNMVRAFVIKNPIFTAGAYTEAEVKINEFEDGDQGIKIVIPAPMNNEAWFKSAYRFVGKLLDEFEVSSLLLTVGYYNLCIYTQICDPD